MTSDVKTLAAIDVGTNSIHMVIVQIQTSIPSFSVIESEKATVSQSWSVTPDSSSVYVLNFDTADIESMVFTKKPIKLSISRRLRLAIGVPIKMSDCPV